MFSDNVLVSLHMKDFEFLGDAPLVYMKRTKTDQEGDHGRLPYHCYFNSVDPHLNLGLALGLYLLTSICLSSLQDGIIRGGSWQ